jgi:cell fate regulator YaaT (PSP1 superfamily)
LTEFDLMKKFYAKTSRWENPFLIQASQSLENGDVVIIETESGMTSAIIEREAPSQRKESKDQVPAAAKYIRKANLVDLKNIREYQKKEQEALKVCQGEAKKSGLPMKIVGARYSFEGGGITFAFTSDGRVDFRELVKNLSKKLQRSIRLHQIGARDESRRSGGYGICGRELCCVRFKSNLPSITSEMAKIQQISHRGSERISGICGRLMCCLAFEEEQYRKLAENFPKHGEKVMYKSKPATVKEINLMSGKVGIELEDKTFTFVNKNELE